MVPASIPAWPGTISADAPLVGAGPYVPACDTTSAVAKARCPSTDHVASGTVVAAGR